MSDAAPSQEPEQSRDSRETEGPPEDHHFFHYYAMLVHQQNMLQDSVRTGTYYQAIRENPSTFKDKIVLDVGTGTGILAFFAAQAGAKHVYAVEVSAMADCARELVEKNGMSDRITIIRGKVEQVELPEGVQADVIISEPMGFLLVHERMLESFVAARNRFLRPGGLMMPTTGTIFCGPFSDQALVDEQTGKAAFWDTPSFHGVDLRPLRAAAERHHMAQPVVGYFSPAALLSASYATHRIDFGATTVGELQSITIPLDFPVARAAVCHGLACWFDVSFNGHDKTVVLSTSPFEPGTHWYQCRLLLPSALGVNPGQRLTGSLHLKANAKQSYDVDLSLAIEGTDIRSSAKYSLQDQMYHYMTQSQSYYGDAQATGY